MSDDDSVAKSTDGKLSAEFAATAAFTPESRDAGTSTEGQSPQDTIASGIMEEPGNRIGPYKLLQRLGEGGMGVVYMAEQEKPVKRRVALKIIKTGLDSDQIIARFEQERQALAMMDHPNIAKVLDAGTTTDPHRGPREQPSRNAKQEQPKQLARDDPPRLTRSPNRASGRLFFVMELVKGIPITKFCDQEHLTPRERLELFIPVCQAVQHAHQKGIIHRDLKPSNVIVALYDGRPVPKVIDFGVAKATTQKLTDRTMYTEVGQMVGTLEYMAPEQAELNNLDIDTRADIYSLGVLLYELLTGSPPFSRKDLGSGGFTDMIRLIRDVEPPRPSTKLSCSAELPALAANRKLDGKRLTHAVSGELDWIVMKCLEKERARRYDTANGLATDLARYLSDEPVQACPPSTVYRTRKFLKKHRGPVLAAGLLLAASTVGGIASTYLAVRATRAERAARYAAQSEADQRSRAELVADVLVKAFRKPDPAVAGKDLKVVEILDQAMRDLNTASNVNPLTRAALQDALGQTYLGLGEANIAQRILQASYDTRRDVLGTTHADTLSSLHHLAESFWGASDEVKATELFEECYRLRCDTLGTGHPDTLTSLIGLCSVYQTGAERYRAVHLLEQCLDTCRAELGNTHPVTVNCLDHLAEGYRYAGEFVRAVPLFEECLRCRQATVGSDHPETLATANRLAYAYLDVGDFAKAAPLFEQCLLARRSRLGVDHPGTLTTLEQLGKAYRETGEYSQAIASLKECLRLRRAKLGDDHPDTLDSLNSLAVAYRDNGDFDEAATLLEESLRRRRARGGGTDIGMLLTLNGLGSLYRDNGKAALALPFCEECWQGYRKLLGDDHPDTLIVLGNLAAVYKQLDDIGKAVSLMEDRVRRSKAKLGDDHLETLTALANLGAGYRDIGKSGEAIEILEDCFKKMLAQLGADSPYTLSARMNLATARLANGEIMSAVTELEQCVTAMRSKFGDSHPKTILAASNLARAYRKAGNADLAIPLLKQALQWSKARLGDGHRDTLDLCTNLATALEEQNQWIAAEQQWRELLAIRRKEGDQPVLARTLAALGRNLLRQQKYPGAEPPLREALAIRDIIEPDAWTTFYNKALLGSSLLGQEDFVGTEQFLKAGYDGMKQREGMIPQEEKQRLTEVLEHLVQLYDARDNREESQKWRVKLESTKAARNDNP